MIFDSLNGSLKTSRTFSGGGHGALYSNVKSFIISSGSSPKSYVVSRNKPEGVCSGN